MEQKEFHVVGWLNVLKDNLAHVQKAQAREARLT